MADPMDKAVELAEKLTKAMAQLVEQQGPAAWDLALSATRLKAAVELGVAAAVLIIAGPIAWKVGRHFTANVRRWLGEGPDGPKDESPSAFFFYGGATLVLAGLAIGKGVVGLLNTANWIALIDPRAAIALRIIGGN